MYIPTGIHLASFPINFLCYILFNEFQEIFTLSENHTEIGSEKLQLPAKQMHK